MKKQFKKHQLFSCCTAVTFLRIYVISNLLFADFYSAVQVSDTTMLSKSCGAGNQKISKKNISRSLVLSTGCGCAFLDTSTLIKFCKYVNA